MENKIETLTHEQYEIIREIQKACDNLGANSGLQAILGSWGDTLPQSEILQMIKEYNQITALQHQ